MLNVFFVRALNQHAGPQTPVIIDTVNPGYCLTEFSRHTPEERKGASRASGLVPHTAEEGSRTLLYAALGGKNEEMRGAYVEQVREVREPSNFIVDEQGVKIQERLWVSFRCWNCKDVTLTSDYVCLQGETVQLLAKSTPDVEATVKQYLNN